ncbi:MAG: hypothetical protein LUQ38_10480 [Methanotrichaceae archaeon]|nr:hypothetical protein [Methanotrichaceae archaeon]
MAGLVRMDLIERLRDNDNCLPKIATFNLTFNEAIFMWENIIFTFF